MDYCIVNAEGIIENIIVAEESFATEIEALPSYVGASIGEAYRPPGVAPAKQRELAYTTEKIIEWFGSQITVTEAVTLWQYYAAEGNSRADELKTLIATAKQKIRNMYPDETG